MFSLPWPSVLRRSELVLAASVITHKQVADKVCLDLVGQSATALQRNSSTEIVNVLYGPAALMRRKQVDQPHHFHARFRGTWIW